MDNTTPEGIWYLLANNVRLEMQIATDNGSFTGWIANEGGAHELLSDFSWDPVGRWLEFRRNRSDFVEWYRLSIAYGVAAGRFSQRSSSERPANTAFTFHVTGWSPNWLDAGIVPRTWQLRIANTDHAVLRIDRDQNGALCGRLKVYAPTESLESDLTEIAWDGTQLSFIRIGPGFTEAYSGTVHGRRISGTVNQNGGNIATWQGIRGEVLGFGLGSRLAQRANWQTVTRARLINLTEGMRLADTDIPAITMTNFGTVPLLPALPFPAERDDHPTVGADPYTLQRLQFSFAAGSRFDPANPPPARVYDGYLATPITAPPAGGYRAVIAINGHEGSAAITMSGNSDLYWYGDSLARRGFVVLAIDIGHRPSWDFGPVTHPAIVDDQYADSNWEETSERVFSVQRAVDWLLTQPDIRADGLIMTGLSMGGEVTTMTSALDERISLVIAAGYSPDMYVTDQHGNHPCYQWTYANNHEYLDASDYEALIAPRPLVVETGLVDAIYSAMNPPWAADKQVLSRAYAAYDPDHARLIHYFHYDGHNWHAGDLNPTHPDRPRGVLASVETGPSAPGDFIWQTSSATEKRSDSLYTLIDELLP